MESDRARRGWSALPEELVDQILGELGTNELLATMRVSRALLDSSAEVLYARYHIVGSRFQRCMRGLSASSESKVPSVCGREWKLRMLRRVKAITVLHDSTTMDFAQPCITEPFGEEILFPNLETLVVDYTRCTSAHPGSECRHTSSELNAGWKNTQRIVNTCRARHLCVKGGYGHGGPGEQDKSPESVTIHPGVNSSYGLPWLSVGRVNTFVLSPPEGAGFHSAPVYNKDYLSHNIVSWLQYFQTTFKVPSGESARIWRVGQLDRRILEQAMQRYEGKLDKEDWDETSAEMDIALSREIRDKVDQLYGPIEGGLEVLSLAETGAVICPACGEGVA